MSGNAFKNNMNKRKGVKILADVEKVVESDIITEESTTIEESTITEEVIETETSNDTNCNTNDEPKLIPFDIEGKVTFTKLGISIKDEYKEKINKLASASSIKPNSAVIKVLENVFTDGHFSVEFKKKSPLRVTSYNIPDNMYADIENIANTYGLNKSEVFNKLIEEGLKYQFK